MIVSTCIPTELLEITDRESLADGGVFDLEPWSANDFSVFRSSLCGIVVAATDSQGLPLGYIAYSLQENSICICRIVVLPQLRRKGVGMNLLLMLLSKSATNERRGRILAEVPENNQAAIKLFQASGFIAIETLKVAGHEDRYLFQFERRKPMLEPGNRLTKSMFGKMKNLWNGR